MKNLIIIIAALALASCDKDKDSDNNKTQVAGSYIGDLSMSVWTPTDTLTQVYDSSIATIQIISDDSIFVTQVISSNFTIHFIGIINDGSLSVPSYTDTLTGISIISGSGEISTDTMTYSVEGVINGITRVFDYSGVAQ